MAGRCDFTAVCDSLRGMGRASSRKQRRHAEQGASGPPPIRRQGVARWWLAAAVILVAAGLILWLRPRPPRVVVPMAGPVRGPADAPVVLTEFSDFQCPACRAVEPLLKEILDDYPTQVKLNYVNYPLPQVHRWAETAASAAFCADEQQRFWDYHDRLFERQPNWAKSTEADALFRDYAAELGLDTPAFNDCLKSGRMMARIREDIGRGDALRIEGTPTLYVNERRVQTGGTIGDFRRMIDEELGAGTRP